MMQCKVCKVRGEFSDKSILSRVRACLNWMIWRRYYKGKLIKFVVEDDGVTLLEIVGWWRKDDSLYVRGTLEGYENDAYQSGIELNRAFEVFTNELKRMGCRWLKWGYLRGGLYFTNYC